MKVCVIGVYFGNYPEYIDLWLKSCEYNKNIDFYVVGDTELPRNVENVHFISMSFSQFKAKTELKLGIPIKLNYPFKCCDYKPLYGYILNEFIKEYDFWGYCDFDMVFGNIMSFLEKHNINAYDKFLTLGHLAFIRNSNEINQLPLCIGIQDSIFLKMINEDKTIQFDELTGINSIFKDNKKKIFDKRVFADVSRLWRRIKLAERYDGSTDINYSHQLFYWSEGSVYRSYLIKQDIYNEEFIYIHLKKRRYGKPTYDFNSIKTIIITPDELICSNQPININRNMIYKLNRYYGKCYEWFELVFFSKMKNHILPKSYRSAQNEHK